ncbi:MAG: hypothetical protein NT145_06720 [Elusimicrobia bacterium]|nr:hypothetical protein [Elusimicrobiota bacterium]
MFNIIKTFGKSLINFYHKFIAYESKGTPIISKAILAIFLILIGLFYFSRVHLIYDIPMDKPYYVGEYDEPFAINAGINALKYKLNPVFFKYGGTAVYPYTLVFSIYKKITRQEPMYYMLDKAQGRTHWPITRKIVPVKPIYITKVLAIILFIFGSMIFVMLSTLFLLPLAFWPTSLAFNLWFDRSGILGYYSNQMLPTSHQVIFAGITTILFLKTILAKENKSKFYWLIACAVFASSTVAIQLNAAYIMFLPLSLALEQIISGCIKNKKQWIVLILAIVLPYLIINPASWLSSPDYRKWLLEMLNNASTVDGAWIGRLNYILEFLRDVNLLTSLSAISLIILVISSIYLMIKTNVYAFCGFAVFYLYSFYKIVNMSEQMFQRHLAFLLLPAALFIIFPLIFLYQRSPKNIKILLSAVLLLGTLRTYPYAAVLSGINSLFKGKFSNEWPKESRDYFADYVLKNKVKVFFYDYHNFSLPNTLDYSLLPFSNLSQIPEQLKKDEYIGLILYSPTNKDISNVPGLEKLEIYKIMLEKIQKKYKIVKIFGNSEPTYDIVDEGPLTNPTIVLLK